MLKQKTLLCKSSDITSEELESLDAKHWISDQVKKEAARISDSGARAVPLPVKNCGVLVEHEDISTNGNKRKKRKMKVVNRIEIGSGMKFQGIVQIMVSDSLDYPFREGYRYAHVLCFTAASNTMALLLPYIFAPWLRQVEGEDKDSPVILASSKLEQDAFENTLKEWLFINQSNARSRHSVQEYHTVE